MALPHATVVANRIAARLTERGWNLLDWYGGPDDKIWITLTLPDGRAPCFVHAVTGATTNRFVQAFNAYIGGP